jgi:hypothetical protein
MSEKQKVYGLIVAGVVLALASLLVDAVGIGTEGFGVGQIVGLIVGIVLAGVGVYRGFIRQKPVP